MKIFQTLGTLFTAALFFASVAEAQIGRGIVKVFSVKGDAKLIDVNSGKSQPLVRGMEFKDHSMIVTGSQSTALLLFSNGAAVNVSESSTVRVDEFLQAAYDPSLGTFLVLEEDPSTSKTELFIEEGNIAGQTKKLANGSSYRIGTPVASAGIRGTTWVVAVEYTVAKDGNKIYKISFGTTVGSFGDFLAAPEIPSEAAAAIIEALTSSSEEGQTVALSVTPATGEVTQTVTTTVMEPVSMEAMEAAEAAEGGDAGTESLEESGEQGEPTSKSAEEGPSNDVDTDIIDPDVVSPNT